MDPESRHRFRAPQEAELFLLVAPSLEGRPRLNPWEPPLLPDGEQESSIDGVRQSQGKSPQFLIRIYGQLVR